MMRGGLAWTASVALVALAAGCGGESGGGGTVPVVSAPTPTPSPTATAAPTPAVASVERDIAPTSVSAANAAPSYVHVAINPDPAAAPRGRLFVMLPGTGGPPRGYRLILRAGAVRGYHVIGLTYPNDEAITDLCRGSADDDCTGKARREVLTGVDTSPLVAVDAANSIIGRLTALLSFLAATYPAEGWGQFLSAGQPNWPLIGVAGHSQGAGHAAYLAKLQNLDRVTMFSSPGDTGTAGAAPWLRMTNVTPLARQYGFTHTDDPLAPLAVVLSNWRAIGLDGFGGTVSVDGAAAPYGGSHMLLTSATPGTGTSAAPAHGAPVVDTVTPLDATGAPLFRPVWVHLAFP